jgi:MATE family multidrug resistance protein
MLTTDTAMIGRLGAEPLAGATLSLMIFFLAYVISFGVVTATASLASQAFGARQPRRVRRIIRQGWWVTINNIMMFLALMAIAVFRKQFSRYATLGRFWRPDWAQFRQIFRIGLPIAGTHLMVAGFFIGTVFVIGSFGSEAIAAHMIAIQLPHISIMIPMGLSQAATVRVGHAVGRRNVEAAYCAGWTATAMTVCFMTMMSVVVMLVPEAFVKLFIDASRPENANVLNLAVSFLFFAAFFQIADGIQEVMSGALLGLNDTVVPMFIAGISYWGIGLATGVWLAFQPRPAGSRALARLYL